MREPTIILTFKLSEPVMAHGQVIEELKIRKPVVDDIAAAGGMPFRAVRDDRGSLDISILPNEFMNLLSRLANVPRSTVKSMNVSDFNTLWQEVVPFLMVGRTMPPTSEDDEDEAMMTTPTTPTMTDGSTSAAATPFPVQSPPTATIAPSPSPSTSPTGGDVILQPFSRSA